MIQGNSKIDKRLKKWYTKYTMKLYKNDEMRSAGMRTGVRCTRRTSNEDRNEAQAGHIFIRFHKK